MIDFSQYRCRVGAFNSRRLYFSKTGKAGNMFFNIDNTFNSIYYRERGGKNGRRPNPSPFSAENLPLPIKYLVFDNVNSCIMERKIYCPQQFVFPTILYYKLLMIYSIRDSTVFLLINPVLLIW